MKIQSLFIATAILLSQAASARRDSQKDVADAAEKLRLAMVSGDSLALASIALPALSYGHSGGHVDDYREFVSKIASGKSDFVSIDIMDQRIVVQNKVAIVRHRLKAETADKGVTGHVDLHVMLVWSKEKSGWKLLARQAVKAGK